MRISLKIWLSIGILMAGYLLTVIVITVQAYSTEQRLTLAEKGLFPATEKTKKGLQSYNLQVKLYSDAYFEGRPELIETAKNEAANCDSIMKELLALPGIEQKRREEISDFLKQHATFTNEANLTYAAQASNQEKSDLAVNAALAATNDRLKAKLEKLEKDCSADLNEALTETVSSVAMQRAVTLAVFIFVMIISTVSVARIIISWTQRLGHLVNNLVAFSSQTAIVAGQISSSSQNLAEGSGRSASALAETSSSIEEMSATLTQSAEKSAKASTLATQAKLNGERGIQAVAELTQSLVNIKTSADQTEKIIKTIDEIAFKTRILALNAAVEAAHAGEFGKVFAVIADEVSNLALRASDAARNTSTLIEASIRNADTGVTLSKNVTGVVSDLAITNRTVHELVSEIAVSEKEMSLSIGHITKSLRELEHITQTNAATAEDSATVSDKLNGQAQTLNEHVQSLEQLVGGTSAQPIEQDAAAF